MVTSAVGLVSNFTVKVVVVPDSLVNPVVGATVILATSTLVLVTATSVASLPV